MVQLSLKTTVFQHKVLQVNYTTYDMRREQDSVHPTGSITGRADVMVLSPENDED